MEGAYRWSLAFWSGAPWQVQRYFPDGIDLLVSGSLGDSRQPSTIIDITTGQKLR